jgi:hypothetical protein
VRLAASVCGERRRIAVSLHRPLGADRAGVVGIENLTLHPGSAYLISRATFPGYFLKEKGAVDDCHSQIDLQLFREHLAPALGITHRFVGDEPFCPLTRAYNQRMHDILGDPHGRGPEINVVELARMVKGARPFPPRASENSMPNATGERCVCWCLKEHWPFYSALPLNSLKPYDVIPLTRNITYGNH